jgi:hypothetical protein
MIRPFCSDVEINDADDQQGNTVLLFDDGKISNQRPDLYKHQFSSSCPLWCTDGVGHNDGVDYKIIRL